MKSDWSVVNKLLDYNGFRTVPVSHDRNMVAHVDPDIITETLVEILNELEQKSSKLREYEVN